MQHKISLSFIFSFGILALVMSACLPTIPVSQPATVDEIQDTTNVGVCWTATISPLESVLETPTFELTATSTPSATPTGCQETLGRVESKELVSTFLPNPLKYRIYLPPCYSNQPEKRYPMLILLHGQGFNEDQWDRLGIDEAADKLITSGEIPAMIIVMPWEEYHLQAPRDSGFGSAIVDSLIPEIDQQHATCSVRTCRAIGGISRGAAWAMRLGLTNWQTFGTIGAHSLPPFGGDIYELPYWLQEIPADQTLNIYIDIGVLDPYYEPALEFEQRLTELRISHSWNLFSGTHDEIYWQSHIETYLHWYANSWKALSENQ